MTERKHIMQLLSSNGDGTGISVGTGDYSSNPLSLKLGFDSNKVLILHQLMVKIQDQGKFDPDRYGNNIELINGIRVFVKDINGDVLEELTSFPIKSAGDWAAHCHDVKLHNYGEGDEIMTVRWAAATESGLPLEIRLTDGEYFEVLLNDDFTGLKDHKFIIYGYYKNQDYS